MAVTTTTTEVVAVADPTDPAPVAAHPARRPTGPATRQEWRTPPLWGFRDSGPYLHDGRAATLEEAVALHGGQGAASARRFNRLGAEGQALVREFLETLVVPLPRGGSVASR